MSSKNRIGLDLEASRKLSNRLNDLLSCYQLFYINARGFHWNITGDKFFELHLKFEELYTDALLKVDEIAERILTLGDTPLHSFSDYEQRSEIKAAKNISEGKLAVEIVVESFSTLLQIERELLKASADAGDEGTNSLMSDYIKQQEKWVWMYSSFLK
jgi:starvation-inducible DNA-binding protein